ncbi:outer membrane lipoprotein carrier protein LolA [Parashewanella curva]|uniref:Outer-membrane lipoprotein carrier protein n=1 Tax=Parashewanella curva TaxID=2338552 RepID=A0A3L8PX75_9GAMM|nr:outer membrane lipoprotein chaperone LolA [Parashewanella curva]RLV58662.1 outer membrane lipoprotein carrier protein LolA [Parashewanella curva]
MKNRISTSILTTACLIAVPSFASDADQLRQKLISIKSLHAQFEQKVTDINGKTIQNGSGIFALSNPSKLYWNLIDPDESLIVANKDTVWVYNPFAEEVTLFSLDQAVASSPMTLLIHRDNTTWSKYLVVKKDQCYGITPKIAEGNVTKVTACFKGKEIASFSINDSQGNVSLFTLSEQRELSPEERSLFDFVPPKDVDIDDQRPQY